MHKNNYLFKIMNFNENIGLEFSFNNYECYNIVIISNYYSNYFHKDYSNMIILYYIIVKIYFNVLNVF